MTGGRALVAQEGQQIGDRTLVQSTGGDAGAGVVVRGALDLAHERTGRPAELGGSADAVALPERHASGLPERRAHDDAVVGDLLDPPARRTEGEDVAHA